MIGPTRWRVERILESGVYGQTKCMGDVRGQGGEWGEGGS